jgi:hypothetical protein
MDKRFLPALSSLFPLIVLLCFSATVQAREIALTFDDAPTPDTVLMSGAKRTQKIISPQQAYKDPIAKNFQQVALHKQGRVAAIASSKGIPDAELRHPSENEQYLDQAFAKAGVIVSQ